MNSIMLETSQMLENHPLLIEKESYMVKYLNVLEYFSQKYSANDPWANQTLDRFRKNEDSIEGTLKAVVEDLKIIGFENPYVVPVSSYAAYLAKMNIFSEPLDADEQDELERMSRKMKKPEYQLDKYYPEKIKAAVTIESDEESHQLLLHSGILHLEEIINSMR